MQPPGLRFAHPAPAPGSGFAGPSPEKGGRILVLGGFVQPPRLSLRATAPPRAGRDPALASRGRPKCPRRWPFLAECSAGGGSGGIAV